MKADASGEPDPSVGLLLETLRTYSVSTKEAKLSELLQAAHAPARVQ